MKGTPGDANSSAVHQNVSFFISKLMWNIIDYKEALATIFKIRWTSPRHQAPVHGILALITVRS